jgi:hypothetical protein
MYTEARIFEFAAFAQHALFWLALKILALLPACSLAAADEIYAHLLLKSVTMHNRSPPTTMPMATPMQTTSSIPVLTSA